MKIESNECPNCQSNRPNVVDDDSQIICKDCGFVLDYQFVTSSTNKS